MTRLYTRPRAVWTIIAALLAMAALVFGAEVMATAMIFALVVPLTIFPVLYGTRSPWRSSRTGRSLMALMTGAALLFWISAAYWVLGDMYPGRHWVRLAVYTLMAGGAYSLLVGLVVRQGMDEWVPTVEADDVDEKP